MNHITHDIAHLLVLYENLVSTAIRVHSGQLHLPAVRVNLAGRLAIVVVFDARLFVILVQLHKLLDILVRVDLLCLLDCYTFTLRSSSVGLNHDLKAFFRAVV